MERRSSPVMATVVRCSFSSSTPQPCWWQVVSAARQGPGLSRCLELLPPTHPCTALMLSACLLSPPPPTPRARHPHVARLSHILPPPSRGNGAAVLLLGSSSTVVEKRSSSVAVATVALLSLGGDRLLSETRRGSVPSRRLAPLPHPSPRAAFTSSSHCPSSQQRKQWPWLCLVWCLTVLHHQLREVVLPRQSAHKAAVPHCRPCEIAVPCKYPR